MTHIIKIAVIATIFVGCRFTSENLVTVDGSSTVFPITEAVAEAYQKVFVDAQVTVGLSGTGGGFKKLCQGEIDIAGASRPIKSVEVKLCQKHQVQYVELPIAYDGIAVVVHKSNTWATHITVDELKRLWAPEAQGKITKWSQIRSGWPDKEIHLMGPGVDSGTYDYFTKAIVGKEHASRGDFTASEDDNLLIQGTMRDPLALAYFGYAYAAENLDKIKIIPVQKDDKHAPVSPTIETIRTGVYEPLSRPIFIYVARNALNRPPVQRFVAYYVKEATPLVTDVGYVPLASSTYALVSQRLLAREVGTTFGSKSAKGKSIEALLQQPLPGRTSP